MPRVPLALAAVVTMTLVADAQGDDPIKTKLDKAKTAYASESKKFREEVGAYLDKREEAARKDGNKKLLDQTKEERKAFEERDEVPATTPKMVKQRLTMARAEMEKA